MSAFNILTIILKTRPNVRITLLIFTYSGQSGIEPEYTLREIKMALGANVDGIERFTSRLTLRLKNRSDPFSCFKGANLLKQLIRFNVL